jgi:pimeloyl-ACP methyl ester carboxylesterase
MSLTTPNTDGRVRLRDGRMLAFAEYGPRDGRPVMFFHGAPSSRVQASISSVVEPARRLGVRLIAPDRPGFGHSDFQRGRTIAGWADDVAQLADHLHLERFRVLGTSGGGPYASSCALGLADRVEAAGIVCGVGPMEAPGVLESLGRAERSAVVWARRAPFLLYLSAWWQARGMNRDPEGYATRLAEDSLPPDGELMRDPEVHALFAAMGRDALRQGGRALAREFQLFTRPWGLDLQGIRVPVLLWHGEEDHVCTPAMGRFVASSIPGCRATFLAGEGHVSILVRHFERMLAELMEVN